MAATKGWLTRFILEIAEKQELKSVLKAIKKKTFRFGENRCGFYYLSRNTIQWLKDFGYEVYPADLFDIYAFYVEF